MRVVLSILFLSATISWSQTELELPEIEGEIGINDVPDGWFVISGTPDILSGNGMYPDGTLTVENVNGIGQQGNSVAYLYYNSLSFFEGISTRLSGLTVGEEYSVSFQWQQITLFGEGDITIEGGYLEVVIQDQRLVFENKGRADDEWHLVTITFAAQSPDVDLMLMCNGPGGSFMTRSSCGGIVIDNYCKECRAAGMY